VFHLKMSATLISQREREREGEESSEDEADSSNVSVTAMVFQRGASGPLRRSVIHNAQASHKGLVVRW